MPPKNRRPDPAKVRTALSQQWRALIAYADRLPASKLAAPSVLDAWTVRELIGHLALAARDVAVRGLQPAAHADVDTVDWIVQTGPNAAAIAKETHAASDHGISLHVEVVAAEAVMARVADDAPITLWFGDSRFDDFLTTRVIEAVVHADDLARSTGVPFPHDKTALAICVRALSSAMAVRAPGTAVELRVPPHAAVQCVEGPKHTRGTPPNVVEMDAITWIRLAAGRLSWAEAEEQGVVRASGSRADLAEFLPLLG